MPVTRVFQAVPLSENSEIILDAQASHHIARVLRAAINDSLTIFNGQGGEYSGIISQINKKNVTIKIGKYHSREAESPLTLYLAQGISRGEKMDYTIQKAVELGVSQIIPLITQRCNVRLDQERSEKRLQHWQSIIISACEQSGRNRVPEIVAPQTLVNWLPMVRADQCFVLSPYSQNKLAKVSLQKNQRIVLLVGPEGGLSEIEIQQAEQKGFLSLNLGPRILRTETAAVVGMTALQCYFGDMG